MWYVNILIWYVNILVWYINIVVCHVPKLCESTKCKLHLYTKADPLHSYAHAQWIGIVITIHMQYNTCQPVLKLTKKR